MMMFSSAANVDRRGGIDDQPAARQALADVVVGVALERHRDAARHERAEALAGRALEREADRVVGQALRRRSATSPRSRAACRRCGSRCGSAGDIGAAAALERVLAERDQLLIERLARGRGPAPSCCAADGRRPPADRRGSPTGRARAPSSARAPAHVQPCPPARSSRPSSGSRAPPSARGLPRAMNLKKFSTNSGLPVNFFRSSGSCVAMPTGHVLRWQTRIITQPETTSGAVAKPNSSAPSSAAMTTSRPVFIWPSTCTTMRSRRPLRRSTCCVSARPELPRARRRA